MAKESVSIESLKQAASKLETQRDKIYKTYKNEVIPVLDSSKECLQISGVDTEETKQQFNTVYNSLNKQLSGLVSLLNDTIIPNYSELVDILRSMFNKDFASKFQSLINGMK